MVGALDPVAILLSGVPGAIISICFGVFLYIKNYQNIIVNEWKKQKYVLADELFAAKYILHDFREWSDSEYAAFNRCISRIPFVFNDNEKILDLCQKLTFVDKNNKADPIINDLLQEILRDLKKIEVLDSKYIKSGFVIIPNSKLNVVRKIDEQPKI